MINDSLAPDERFVAERTAAAFRLVEWWARGGYQEYTPKQIEAAMDATRSQVRGWLHTLWALGWVTPIQDDPASTVINRWALSLRVAQFGEWFRKSLITRHQAIDADYHKVANTLLEDLA